MYFAREGAVFHPFLKKKGGIHWLSRLCALQIDEVFELDPLIAEKQELC